jgi:SecD/SecF fusion protein
VFTLTLSKSGAGVDDGDPARMNFDSLRDRILATAEENQIPLAAPQVSLRPLPIPDGWTERSPTGFSEWEVELPLSTEESTRLANSLATAIQSEPVWLSLNNIGQRVAGDMQQKAIAALLVSLIFIVAYIWFRFQKIAYGLAAVVALLHDVLITLGIVALSHWLYGPLGFLMIEDFKIDLIMVAAFLTIIGYSLNDTIVVFDRIREVRGKSPRLTAAMVNSSVNQTLSRTILTSSTTLLTVVLLFFFGGEGIHGFAFALFIGIVVGTYSSIFIAAPVLLWIANRQQAPTGSVALSGGRKVGSSPTA